MSTWQVFVGLTVKLGAMVLLAVAVAVPLSGVLDRMMEGGE